MSDKALDIKALKDDQTILDIISLAERFGLDKVVLYGSRAKGTAGRFSDYDLAAYGEESRVIDFSLFLSDEYSSPYFFDVAHEPYISQGLDEEIERTGIVLYEKI